MRALRITALLIIFLVFSLAGVGFLLGKGIEKSFLSPSFYPGVIQEVELSSILANGLTEKAKERTSYDQRLSADQIQSIENGFQQAVSRAFTEEWAEGVALNVIKDGLAYVKGEQESLTAVIDLGERKDIIRQQLKEQVNSSFQEKSGISPQVESRIRSQRVAAANKMLERVPDKVELAELLAQHPYSKKIKEGISKFQRVYNFFHTYSYPIMIILGILILVLGGIISGWKWLGSGMLVSGGISFALLFGVAKFLSPLINNLGAGLPTEQLRILVDPFFGKMYTLSFYYFLAGLILLLAGIFIEKSRKKKEE